MKLFLYLSSMSYGGTGDMKTMFYVFLNYRINGQYYILVTKFPREEF